MGRRGLSGLRGVLVLTVCFQVNAKAELSTSVTSMLMPALLGVTGRRVDDEYARLLKIDPHVTVRTANGGASCTGTMISDRKLITAAHCVDKTNPTGGINIDGIYSTNAFVNPKYTGKETSQYDLAVVLFPAGTGEFLGINSYPMLAGKKQTSGTAFLVGYGMSDFHKMIAEEGEAGAGVRGWGRTKIVDNYGGMILTDETRFTNSLAVFKVDPKKQPSAALEGDSGSAVYNRKGEIIGTISTMAIGESQYRIPLGSIAIKATYEHQVNNQIVDIISPSSQMMLAKAEACELENDCAPIVDNETKEVPDNVFAGIPIGTITEEDLKKYESGMPNLLTMTSPFEKVTLRTGRFFNESTGKTYFMTPFYAEGELKTVAVRELVNDVPSDPKFYICAGGTFCLSAQMDSTLQLDAKNRGRAFSISPAAKLEPDYLKASSITFTSDVVQVVADTNQAEEYTLQ